MQIYITSKIKLSKANEIEYIVSRNWFIFLKKVFPKAQLLIINEETALPKNADLLIISGGNNVASSLNCSKADVIRNYRDSKLLSFAIKNRIKTLGVCYGAELIAEKFKSKITKIANHVGKHSIIFSKNSIYNPKNKTSIVNSYHDYGIKELGENLQALANSKDGTIEFFKHKKFYLYGIMWHPERRKALNKLDVKIFTNIIYESKSGNT